MLTRHCHRWAGSAVSRGARGAKKKARAVGAGLACLSGLAVGQRPRGGCRGGKSHRRRVPLLAVLDGHYWSGMCPFIECLLAGLEAWLAAARHVIVGGGGRAVGLLGGRSSV